MAIGGEVHARIGQGLLVLVGIGHDDTPEDVEYLVQKCVKLRIFADGDGVMNLDIKQINGQILAISQFTLHASTRKGNRPSYIAAAGEATAKPLYENFIHRASVALGQPVQAGVFGADMQVELVNDGPVTIWIDSKEQKQAK